MWSTSSPRPGGRRPRGPARPTVAPSSPQRDGTAARRRGDRSSLFWRKAACTRSRCVSGWGSPVRRPPAARTRWQRPSPPRPTASRHRAVCRIRGARWPRPPRFPGAAGRGRRRRCPGGGGRPAHCGAGGQGVGWFAVLRAVVRARGQGRSQSAIAVKLGLTQPGVHKMLIRAGVTPEVGERTLWVSTPGQL